MSKAEASHDDSSHTNDDEYHFYFVKKVKRLDLLEPSLSTLSFFFFALLFTASFFYVDYTAIVKRTGFHPFSSSSSSSSSSSLPPSVEFKDVNYCDVFDGNWVWDDTYPLYHSENCSFIDDSFRCYENGRPDTSYTKWRWQPKLCNLPRFDARKMLEKLRDKRLVFVGDSIGRNQWESLLCMLSSSITNKSTVYEVNGNPITTHYMGFLSFKFEDYNCTVEYYRSSFLVEEGHPPPGAPQEVKRTLRLDLMDWTFPHWRDADVVILNTAHWWNQEKTFRSGYYFQVGDEVKNNMTLEDAYRKSVETIFDWIASKVNMNKTYVLFRTYAPTHFRGGDWNTGGSCLLDTLPDLGTLPTITDIHFRTIFDVLKERMMSKSSEVVMKLDLLNITQMSLRRKDGHASIYRYGPGKRTAPINKQDCSHWCLPGVPDSWNEILYALLLKRDAFGASNTTNVS